MKFEGYGNRIYKQRPSCVRAHYVILLGIALTVWFSYYFFIKPDKPERIDKELIRLNEFPTVQNPNSGGGEAAEDKSIADSVQSIPEAYNPENIKQRYDKEIVELRNFLKEKEYSKAESLLYDLAKKDSELASRLYTYVGVFCYKDKEYEYARIFLQKSIDINPVDFYARKYLAYAYYKMNNLTFSRFEMEKALDITPDDDELLALRNQLERENNAMTGYRDSVRRQFIVQFSQREHSEIKDMVVEILEDAYREIGRSINHYPSRSINVILYNEKAFFDVTRAPGWAGGLYDGNIRIPIQGVEGQEALLKRVLYHEFVHALVNSITKRCPLWVNEGLAEYFSEDSGLISMGASILRSFPKEIIKHGILRYIENGFPSGGSSVTAAYLISYLAVSKLISNYGILSVRSFIEATGRGLDTDAAFMNAFYCSYQGFQESLTE